jgi:hypothetical protein
MTSPRLSPEQRRALMLLASSSGGVNAALLLHIHGFKRQVLAGLIRRRLAVARREVTEAGRCALPTKRAGGAARLLGELVGRVRRTILMVVTVTPLSPKLCRVDRDQASSPDSTPGGAAAVVGHDWGGGQSRACDAHLFESDDRRQVDRGR